MKLVIIFSRHLKSISGILGCTTDIPALKGQTPAGKMDRLTVNQNKPSCAL